MFAKLVQKTQQGTVVKSCLKTLDLSNNQISSLGLTWIVRVLSVTSQCFIVLSSNFFAIDLLVSFCRAASLI